MHFFLGLFLGGRELVPVIFSLEDQLVPMSVFLSISKNLRVLNVVGSGKKNIISEPISVRLMDFIRKNTNI